MCNRLGGTSAKESSPDHYAVTSKTGISIANDLPYRRAQSFITPSTRGEGLDSSSQGDSMGLYKTGSITSYSAAQRAQSSLDHWEDEGCGIEIPPDESLQSHSNLLSPKFNSPCVGSDTSPHTFASDRKENSVSILHRLEGEALRSLRRLLISSFPLPTWYHSHGKLVRHELSEIESRLELLPTKNLAFTWWIDHDCELDERSAVANKKQPHEEMLFAHGRMADSIRDNPQVKTVLHNWEVEFRHIFRESLDLQVMEWQLDLEIDGSEAIMDVFLCSLLGEIDYRLRGNRRATGPTSQSRARVERSIRMRIQFWCHHCKTQYAESTVCSQCKHQRCDRCMRMPRMQKTSKVRLADAARKYNILSTGNLQAHLTSEPRERTNGQGSSRSTSSDPPSSQVSNAGGNDANGITKRSRLTFEPCNEGDGDEQDDRRGGRGNNPKRVKPTADVYAQYLVCTEHAAGREAENPSCVFSAWPTVDRLKQVS